MVSLSPSEKAILLKSPYIKKITAKQIIFTEEFKRLACQQSLKGIPRKEIFKVLGVDCFDMEFINTCIKRWRIKEEDDFQDLRGKTKSGRKKKLENMSIEELKAEVAYQKQEIEYLKKLRGLTK